MTEKMVKGTILEDTVRLIRGNKDRDWDKYLTPEDWKIVNSKILSSSWYPLETFRRCSTATFFLLAGENLELARQQGKVRGRELFEGVYRILVIKKDPMTALDRFLHMYGQLFNFSTIRGERAGEKSMKIFLDYDPDDIGYEAYCYLLMGYLEQLIEMTEGKNIRIVITAKQWTGSPETIFDISWD
jgi:hypothetical protein